MRYVTHLGDVLSGGLGALLVGQGHALLEVGAGLLLLALGGLSHHVDHLPPRAHQLRFALKEQIDRR